MDMERERALTLAHEAEINRGSGGPDAVVSRARLYLDFLRGTSDAKVIDAAHEFAKKITQPTF
jgi:hypothetical protein